MNQKPQLKFFLFIIMILDGIPSLGQTISLYEENPHYFFYKGEPSVLIGSTEHYGAVINPDFDFDLYLKTLKKLGLNLTRIWLGDYVEKPGDFCLSKNTSAPLPGRFLTPWLRSKQTGFALGGNKFDLEKWDSKFFNRLHAFIKQASDNGIVVECILFFVGPNWQYLPMNPDNNINNTSHIKSMDYMTLNNGNILEYQKRYCIKLIKELNAYDNVIFNIANEPWFYNQEHPGFSSPPRDETKEWIREVSEWIVDQEQNLPKQHLIATDYTNEGTLIRHKEQEKYWKNISVFNHHYDKDAESVKLNYGINKVLAFNETGLMPPFTPQYRIQGWKYLLSGGGMYNNLDFTFEAGNEDGRGKTEFLCDNYNGCNDSQVKYEMAALLNFMESFDFEKCRPNNKIIWGFGDQQYSVLENPGEEYAIYIYGGTNKSSIRLNLIAETYGIQWINPSDGKVIEQDEKETSDDGSLNLMSPAYIDDIVLLLKRKRS